MNRNYQRLKTGEKIKLDIRTNDEICQEGNQSKNTKIQEGSKVSFKELLHKGQEAILQHL